MKKFRNGFVQVILLILVVVVSFLSLRYLYSYNVSRNSSKTTVSPSFSPLSGDKVTISSLQVQYDQLKKYLTVEAVLLGVSDNISLSFHDLGGQKEISVEPERSWIPASTIKSYVLLEAFRQKKLGLIDFDQTVAINAQNVVPTELETDEFLRLREGTQVTIKQLVESMIIQSDNTAYNTLLDILDRRNVNATLRNLGLTESVIGEKLNLDEGQFTQDLQVSGRQPNTTTVKDLATFFDLLGTNKLDNSEEMLSILKRQKINNMIPALLPSDVAVAHKTGDWAPIYHDGGIIYKPSEPFVFVAFTNSNNPSVIAALARVAYFQDAKVVGEPINVKASNGTFAQSGDVYLADKLDESRVLAANTSQNPLQITAADLGITSSDLSIDLPDAQKLKAAWVTPGSLFYGVKQFFESLPLKNAKNDTQKSKAYLDLSTSRLAEAKTLIGSSQYDKVDEVLGRSQDYLAQAANLASKDQSDQLKLQLKQVSDLHVAVFAQSAKTVSQADKEKYIDTVYDYYRRNQKEVAPVVRDSVVANPFEQVPIIGTVKNISSDKATMQFEDGSTKDVVLSDLTPVRKFESKNIDDKSSLTVGSKIAVVGQKTKGNTIVPQFIMKDIPKELPERQEGVIQKIDTRVNTMTIRNRTGQDQELKVSDQTIIKSRDTDASLEGIKAGSQVTFFGSNSNNPISSPADVASNSPKSSPVGAIYNNPASPFPSGISKSPSSGGSKQINATSITVVGNSSGKNEKKSSSGSKPSGDSGAKKTDQNKSNDSHSAPPPQQSKTEEHKNTDSTPPKK